MDKNEIILYETTDHAVKLNVTTDHETVWLSRSQIAELFERDVSVIGRHINAVFKEKELDKKAMCKICTFLILTKQLSFILST